MTKIIKLTNDEKQPLQLILELTNIPPAIYDELVEMTEAFRLETEKVFQRHQAEIQSIRPARQKVEIEYVKLDKAVSED